MNRMEMLEIPGVKKQFYSWKELMEDCLELTDNKIKNQKFDFIVAISRGGLIPATLLAYLLKIKKISTINFCHYVADGITGKLKLISPPPNIKDSRVLLVDDITDTGETLLGAKELLEKKNNRVVTATLHFKPRSKIVPDYFVHTVESWIVYPWEPPYLK